MRAWPLVAACGIIVGIVGLAGGQVLPQSELDPEVTWEPEQLPDPLDVPGKEYSNDVDKDADGNEDAGQVVHWEGDGTTLWDSFDYTGGEAGPGGGTLNPAGEVFQVDALGNVRDKYFLDLDGLREVDNEQIGDTVSLLASFENNKNIYYSRSSYRDGGAGQWANWSTNINNTQDALDDVDGLEIWGPDDRDDACLYSRAGDDDPNGTGRVSVWRWKPAQLDRNVPYLLTQTLLDAVIDDNNQTIDWNTWDDSLFDVDAMLVWDVDDDDEFGEGLADAGIHGNDRILFSVRPIAGLFDGGEIWYYEYGDATASFLTHGNDANGDPRVWNTAHDVSAHYGVGASENINALEALPEPGTLALLGLGAAGLLLRRRHLRA